MTGGRKKHCDEKRDTQLINIVIDANDDTCFMRRECGGRLQIKGRPQKSPMNIRMNGLRLEWTHEATDNVLNLSGFRR